MFSYMYTLIECIKSLDNKIPHTMIAKDFCMWYKIMHV